MKSLENHIGRHYSDFDLSDNTFTNYAVWHESVPQSIIDSWNILQTDERFLIACIADYNDTMARMRGCL